MSKVKSYLIALLLVGCAGATPGNLSGLPEYHPPLPAPYEVCPVSWEVLDVDGRAKVALSYDENVTAAQCNKDIERYISQLITAVCSYRQTLEEGICIEHQTTKNLHNSNTKD